MSGNRTRVIIYSSNAPDSFVEQQPEIKSNRAAASALRCPSGSKRLSLS
jgi:hypothetical protein